jgi:hypothetical protein
MSANAEITKWNARPSTGCFDPGALISFRDHETLIYFKKKIITKATKTFVIFFTVFIFHWGRRYTVFVRFSFCLLGVLNNFE